LQFPHFQRGFLSPGCPVLHRIAFAVVSEWYQFSPCIRVSLLGTAPRSVKLNLAIVVCLRD
jgi:hypothetical protein